MDESYFPTNQEFFIDLPLYTRIPVNDENFGKILTFICYIGSIDTYCVECAQESIFNVQQTRQARDNIFRSSWADSRFLDFTAVCSRNRTHVARYAFKISEESGVTKIGQYPSMADADGVKLKKYRKVLSAELYQGFARAVGLATHGVGAGSVVYLRRIFEALIEEAHLEAKEDNDWLNANEATYLKARVADKVKSLKSYLPSYLVDHHTMYSVLSSGVHDMSEQECLELFPTLKIGIELILDQKIQKKEEAEKVAALQKVLSGKASGGIR